MVSISLVLLLSLANLIYTAPVPTAFTDVSRARTDVIPDHTPISVPFMQLVQTQEPELTDTPEEISEPSVSADTDDTQLVGVPVPKVPRNMPYYSLTPIPLPATQPNSHVPYMYAHVPGSFTESTPEAQPAIELLPSPAELLVPTNEPIDPSPEAC